MPRYLVTVLWLLVSLTVPVGAGLDVTCRLMHAGMITPAVDVAADPHAHHRDGRHAPVHQDPGNHDHGAADIGCCHLMGVSAADLPPQTAAIVRLSLLANTAYWLANHPIRGLSPPPALGPPRA